MGRKPVEVKRTPSEYPQIAFRVTAEQKLEISKEIEKIQKQLNSKRPEGTPFINKNDVFLRALAEGLKRLR